MELWNERSTILVRLNFYDEDDAAVIPTCAVYRIDETLKGIAIKATTSISGLASDVDVTVTSTEQYIVGDGGSEFHRMTVEYKYGSAPVKTGTAEHTWKVRDLVDVLTT